MASKVVFLGNSNKMQQSGRKWPAGKSLFVFLKMVATPQKWPYTLELFLGFSRFLLCLFQVILWLKNTQDTIAEMDPDDILPGICFKTGQKEFYYFIIYNY